MAVVVVVVRFATLLAADPYLTGETDEREDPGGPRVFTEEESILRGNTTWGGSARL